MNDIFQQTGIKTAELADPPVIPSVVAHIWTWFFDLSRGRQNGMSMNPIAWNDILAYRTLTGQQMQRWELDILAMFDSIYLDVMQSDQAEVKSGF